MAKLTLANLTNLENETTAVNAINANNALLEAALENTLSRDGTSPNTMSANLDMNSYRITNLPIPTSNSEAARHGDIQTYVDDAETEATAAAASAAAAAASASAAAASAVAAAANEAATDLAMNTAELYADLLENPDMGFIADTPVVGDWDLGSII